MSKIKIGDKVKYHPLRQNKDWFTHIGVVKRIKLKPNNFGCDVAWIEGKCGCVDMEFLSKGGAE